MNCEFYTKNATRIFNEWFVPKSQKNTLNNWKNDVVTVVVKITISSIHTYYIRLISNITPR